MKTTQDTVLLTGASSGIGLELAKLFAKDKYNMVLVSRSEQSLQDVSSELKALGAGEITIIEKDLSLPYAAAEIYDETKRLGIQIDILVNDAGLGSYGKFSETDIEREMDIIQINIGATVHLSKLYLKDMLSRNKGRILQLASIASYQPTPLLAVYAATKAFILSFSDAVSRELKDTNITITSLIPPPTDTDFFRKAGMEHTKAAQEPKDAGEVAKAGYEALMKGELHAYGPGAREMAAMSTLMSNQQVTKMAEKQMQPADQK
jgi:short-subunit dehydrogenase